MSKKAETFKKRADKLVFKLEKLIGAMPEKGNSETESQKVFMRNQLYMFSQSICGVEESDFKN
jgi:hypothetical protein